MRVTSCTLRSKSESRRRSKYSRWKTLTRRYRQSRTKTWWGRRSCCRSAWCIVLVIDRIGRALGFRVGMLRQLLHCERDCLLKLRVVAFADGLGVLLDDNIRFDTMILDIPLTFGREECDG